jgi:hypothetical protein
LTFTSATTGTFNHTVNDGANVATEQVDRVADLRSARRRVWGAQPNLALATNQ